MQLKNKPVTTAFVQTRDGGPHAYCRQRGFTLVLSLLLLLILTILGVTAVNISTLQEKMSGNLRDQDVAFQASESALRYAELAVNQMWVSGKPTPISVNSCTSSTCAWDTDVPQPLNDNWWNINKQEYGGTGKQLTQTTADPNYVVEYLANVTDSGQRGDKYAPPSGMQYYRITARGQGTTPFSLSILQSTYQIQYQN